MELGRGRDRDFARCVRILFVLAALFGTETGCRTHTSVPASGSPLTLRLGWAVSADTPFSGLRQLVGLLAAEGLVRAGDDGRMQPWLADSWTQTQGGQSLTLKLKPHVRFSDGTALDPDAVSKLLPSAIKGMSADLLEDIEHIEPSGPDGVRVTFRNPSMLHLEALEGSLTKEGAQKTGTGPFMTA